MQTKNKLIQTLIITSIFCLLLSIIPISQVQAQATTLQITNLAGTNYNYTLEQLIAMPKTVVHADLLCYGSVVTSGDWTGIQLSYLLNLTQATSNVTSLKFVASDGYVVNLPIDLAMQPQIIIAYAQNNETLSQGLRLILPGYNGAAWIAMVTSISMSTLQTEYPAQNYADRTLPGQTARSGNSQPTPQPQQTAVPPTPTPQTTPNSTPPTQTAAPTNTTNPNQQTSAPQSSSNEGSDAHLVFLYVIASTLVIVLAILGSLAYKRKKSLKTS